MKLLLRLCGLLLFFAFLPAGFGQASSLKVSRIEIKHVGPPAASDDLIRANLRTKVGEPYLRAAVDDDIHNLYATRQFSNIRVSSEITPDGVVLTYIVQGHPLLTAIKFTGNKKYKDSKLLKKISSKTGEPLDERKLFTDSQEIVKLYQKAGYPGTTVKAVPSVIEENGRATATFEITESPKTKIARVDFVGADAFSQKELRKAIKTRRRWWLSWLTGSGVFKDDQFEEDRERLAAFYRERGYIDFDLKDVQFEYPSPRRMNIRFNVYEGRQYKVGSVTFSGTTFLPTNAVSPAFTPAPEPKPKNGPAHDEWTQTRLLNKNFKMKAGDVFKPQGLSDDEQAVADYYGAKGYIDVGPYSRNLLIGKIPNTENGTMDLEFKIDEGQKNYIEKIEIRGNTKTKDRVIRRELAVTPGETFDMVRVKVSKQRLEGLQYFEKIDTRPEPTEVPNRKNLVIGVEEKNTGNLTMGAGFSSVDSVIGFVEVSQGNFDLFNPPNFTGGGQKFRLRVQLGLQRQDYLISFVEPWFTGRKLALGVDLYRHDYNFQSLESLYDETRTGGSVSLTRALGSDFLIGSVGYTIEEVGIRFNGLIVHDQIPNPRPNNIPDDLLKEDGSSLISKVNASLAYDTLNSVTLPNKGQRTELILTVAGPFGGEKDYWKTEIHTSWYFPGFLKGHVLEVLGGSGVADGYGDTDDVPFYDRFYLGGVGSLRGYRYRSVSPRQPDSPGFHSNEPIGGDTYYFGSVDYSVPIIKSETERGVGMRFAVFYDIGNVMSDPFTYDFKNYNDNWGLGLRLNLPIGPLRLDYGIPIHHDKFNGSGGKFQFSVGYKREF